MLIKVDTKAAFYLEFNNTLYESLGTFRQKNTPTSRQYVIYIS